MKSNRRERCEHITLLSSENRQRDDRNAIVLSDTAGVHAGLWLDRYITSLERFKGGQGDSAQSAQQKLVREVASLGIPDIYRAFYTRWETCLQEAGVTRRVFSAKNLLAVGLGNEGVLETSVALHRTYGVPFIPGSALKGLAASYARLMAGPDWQQGKPAYRAVFGDTENAGFVIFFDALYIPVSSCEEAPRQTNAKPDCPLRPDIITVHHPKYYQGQKDAPPADWDSPNPVSFLSATGCYLVALAAPDLENADKWLANVFDLLEEALLIIGIGAKTLSGYGRMKMVRSTEAAHPETRVSTGLIEEISKIRDVPSQLHGYYQRWKQLEIEEARRIVARAIVAKVAEAHREKWANERSWYQELKRFLDIP